MNKLMLRFVASTKKKKDTKPNFRHGCPQGTPRNKGRFEVILRDVRPAGYDRKEPLIPLSIFVHIKVFTAYSRLKFRFIFTQKNTE